MKYKALQIAIAESLGWKIHPSGIQKPGDDKPIDKDYQSALDMVPNWPEDHNAAMQLCDVLAKEGWNVSLSKVPAGEWFCSFENGALTRGAFASTAALAISIAYCKVRGIYQEGEKV